MLLICKIFLNEKNWKHCANNFHISKLSKNWGGVEKVKEAMHHKNTIIIINVICRDNKGSTNNETVKKSVVNSFSI